ncbi:MAG: universal stress protein [Candidatus Nealsonbacteria bacterium]|nr:universal stress protein [Candidatus Nealsonbacteria bacterium]
MSWLPRETVVVPIDFSEDSFAAIDVALEMGADLHVIHVLPTLEPNDPGVIWATVDDQSRIEHATEAIHKELAARGHNGLQVAIRFGDPGHEIAQYAAEVNAGAIVLSSHGQSALMHLLIGSVAERIVRLARCPVLVLKK